MRIAGMICLVFCLSIHSYSLFAQTEPPPPNLEGPEEPTSLPISPATYHHLDISTPCRNLLMFFTKQQHAIADRQVGFWEPGSISMTIDQQRQYLGAQRSLVGNETQELDTYEEKYFLRGIVPTLTGWGNCGEHTSTLWVELQERYDLFLDAYLGCKRAEVFKTRVTFRNQRVDHVWIEVWVPKRDGTERLVLEYGEDDPLAFEGTYQELEGYYLVFDPTVSSLGPYRVVRNMLFAQYDSYVTPIEELEIERRWLNPRLITGKAYESIHQTAFEIKEQLVTKEEAILAERQNASHPSSNIQVPISMQLSPQFLGSTEPIDHE